MPVMIICVMAQVEENLLTFGGGFSCLSLCFN
jgi:hypothetical protein